jgi:8-oxo-dGTP diphosphatase
MQHHIELIARGVLLQGSTVLLCQNAKHGYWYLPGGHVEFGEAAAAALAREFQEECRLTVQVKDCVLVTETLFQARRPHHEVNLVFRVLATAEAAEVRSAEEAIAFSWVELAALPDLDVRPPSIKAWLAAGGRSENPVSCTWVSEVQSAS